MKPENMQTTPAATAFDPPPGSAIRETAHRLVSLDAYRGFVMLLMASDGLNFGDVSQRLPDSSLWRFLAQQTEHAAWRGCSLWDVIQPLFMFLVGVALPFSLASRRARGQTFGPMLGHAVWRSLLLIFLGIFLRSVGRPLPYFTFEDVLTQIGLGYTFLFLLAWTSRRIQLGAALFLLVAYWAAFALYPLPGANFDFHSVGVPADWPHLTGFAAHWDKNTNFGAAADQWFLNLFPREKPFVYNDGGYLTLSFVPSLATMLFGLLAGGFLRRPCPPARKVQVLAGVGIACLIIGMALDLSGICPSVKRIWTPAWTIFSTGWTCLLLAAFYAVVDWKGHRRWAFPLVVVGMNSIAMYMMDHLWDTFVKKTLYEWLGAGFFNLFGSIYAPIMEMVMLLLVLWLICYWMYRRKLFLKV